MRVFDCGIDQARELARAAGWTPAEIDAAEAADGCGFLVPAGYVGGPADPEWWAAMGAARRNDIRAARRRDDY